MVYQSEDGVTLTVRLIRSFEFRNIKIHVLHQINLDQEVLEFQEHVRTEIAKQASIPPPVRNYHYDTMKINHQPFKSKTSDTALVLEHDDTLIFKPGKTLRECGVVNETEISFFKKSDYEKYKSNPELKW